MEMSEFKSAVEKIGLSDNALAGFLNLFARYKNNEPARLAWDRIHSPDPVRQRVYDELVLPAPEREAEALSRLAVCKLNGGLGTSMGCVRPKSSIIAKNGKSFLDLILLQLEEISIRTQINVPLLLMNSFHTHQDTLKILEGRATSLEITCFQQNHYLRFDRATDQPLDPELVGDDAWYPPGHGDIYSCLRDQGLMDELLSRGKEILFVSNSDNLGAVVDAKIAHTMLEQDIPLIMEVTPKTAADVKGGTLYEDEEGRLHLLELAQVPEEHVEEFCSSGKFSAFNTNNIWIHLRHLKRRLEQGLMELNLIVNQKQVMGRPVVQLETAIGAGIESFEGARGLVVGRDRFLPVKNTSDLMLIQSALFDFKNGRMVKSPTRDRKILPSIIFEEPFNHLEEYQKRIPVIPDMTELDSLQLAGDVCFEGAVTLKGQVTLVGKEEPIRIAAGACLEDCRMIR